MSVYISVKQAADRLNVSPATIRRLIRERELRARKKTHALNSPFLVEEQSAEEYMRRLMPRS